MTIAVTLGVPSHLIEPEKITELEQLLTDHLRAILANNETFSLCLTLVTGELEFVFDDVPLKVREHLREVVVDVLVEHTRNWKRALLLAETSLQQKIEQRGETPNLAQTLKNTKESRMRLDTFLLAQ
jgi:hypothetical protein